MALFRSLAEAAGAFGPCALTIGNFDGTHIGHQRIFRRVAEVARQHGWKPSALTFDPHPAKVVAPERAPKLLTTPEERLRSMKALGIEQVLMLPFNRELASLTPERFAKEVLSDALEARAVLVGDNFHFGVKQSGNVATLRELGKRLNFEVEIVEAVPYRGRIVSSSETRRSIESGEVSTAGRMLGRWFALEGDVVTGHGVGSKQTVPTLNLSTRAEVLPAPGVYVTRCTDLGDGRSWPAVTNVGYRPTFNDGSGLSIETFLLEPLLGLSPGQIRVEFLERLREERKFESAESLKAQILRDARRAVDFHRRLMKWSCYTGTSTPNQPLERNA